MMAVYGRKERVKGGGDGRVSLTYKRRMIVYVACKKGSREYFRRAGGEMLARKWAYYRGK